MIKLFLAGEGSTELGEWAKHPTWRSRVGQPGLIETLLTKLDLPSWQVVGAVIWKDIVALTPGGHREREHRNVKGAALHALEARADLLVLVRDRDRVLDREAAMQRALAEIAAEGDWLPTVGGLAIEAIEAWVLAFLGQHMPEHRSDPKSTLAAAPYSVESLQAKAEAVEQGDVERAQALAPSLSRWIQSARAQLRSLRHDP